MQRDAERAGHAQRYAQPGAARAGNSSLHPALRSAVPHLSWGLAQVDGAELLRSAGRRFLRRAFHASAGTDASTLPTLPTLLMLPIPTPLTTTRENRATGSCVCTHGMDSTAVNATVCSPRLMPGVPMRPPAAPTLVRAPTPRTLVQAPTPRTLVRAPTPRALVQAPMPRTLTRHPHRGLHLRPQHPNQLMTPTCLRRACKRPSYRM
jgi:hypothetical protein